MSNKLYTTPEASEKTGIPQSTIRSWLTRYPEQFQLEIHVQIDEHQRKLWTQEGIKQLLKRKDSSTEEVSEEVNITENNHLLEKLLEAGAEQMATIFFEQLPTRTVERISRMLSNPTPEEKVLIDNSVNSALNSGVNYLDPKPMRSLE